MSVGKKIFRLMFFIMLFGVCSTPLFAEEDKHTPEPYGKDEFPLWATELRRFEILTFGALPFVTMLSFWSYDIGRSIKHKGDPAYAPWPIKDPAVAKPLTSEEQLKIFGTAVGISIGIALFDISYRAIRREIQRKKLERENLIDEQVIQLTPLENDYSPDNASTPKPNDDGKTERADAETNASDGNAE